MQTCEHVPGDQHKHQPIAADDSPSPPRNRGKKRTKKENVGSKRGAIELVLGWGPDSGRARQQDRQPTRVGVRFSADSTDGVTAQRSRSKWRGCDVVARSRYASRLDQLAVHPWRPTRTAQGSSLLRMDGGEISIFNPSLVRPSTFNL
jgi:hypothetical protein